MDVLICNVGIFDVEQFWDITDAEWNRYLETNFLSNVRLCRHYLKPMLDRKEVLLSPLFPLPARSPACLSNLLFSVPRATGLQEPPGDAGNTGALLMRRGIIVCLPVSHAQQGRNLLGKALEFGSEHGTYMPQPVPKQAGRESQELLVCS